MSTVNTFSRRNRIVAPRPPRIMPIGETLPSAITELGASAYRGTHGNSSRGGTLDMPGATVRIDMTARGPARSRMTASPSRGHSSHWILGDFFRPIESMTQYQPLKIISIPTNRPMTYSPDNGHRL
jgi:hypothetical protein